MFEGSFRQKAFWGHALEKNEKPGRERCEEEAKTDREQQLTGRTVRSSVFWRALPAFSFSLHVPWYWCWISDRCITMMYSHCISLRRLVCPKRRSAGIMMFWSITISSGKGRIHSRFRISQCRSRGAFIFERWNVFLWRCSTGWSSCWFYSQVGSSGMYAGGRLDFCGRRLSHLLWSRRCSECS